MLAIILDFDSGELYPISIDRASASFADYIKSSRRGTIKRTAVRQSSVIIPLGTNALVEIGSTIPANTRR